MNIVADPVETIHVYMVPEEEKRPYTVLPLVCALLCLLGIAAVTTYSAEHPYYQHERLRVPATFLPLKVFKAEAPIIPTGVKTYPATYATGMLTLTNGSVLSETLPSGVIFNTGNSIEVQTTASVFIPAGTADGYGAATVEAKAVANGKQGNIPAFAVNAVYGTALYIRNLSPFTGGQDAYSVAIQLPRDRQTAINLARTFIASQKAQVLATLASPCKEIVNNQAAIVNLIVDCQFAIYHIPSYMRVLGAELVGKDFLVDVLFMPSPKRIWVR